MLETSNPTGESKIKNWALDGDESKIKQGCK